MADTVDGTTYFVDKLWGLSLRYDLGDADAHELVGRSAPDVEFEDGTRLGSRLEKECARFVVVDFEGSTDVAEFVQSLEPRVGYSTGHARQTFGLKAILVRPDGIVAWVARDQVDVGALRGALERWIKLSASVP